MDNKIYPHTPGMSFNLFNQKTYNQSSRVNPEYNKYQNEHNINKDSYTYLQTKKHNNNYYKKYINSNNNNNNYQSLIDFSEPEPQVFQGFNQISNIDNKNNNNYNNSFDLQINNLDIKPITRKNKNHNYFSNKKNKKLLEEYFQLKNENKTNYKTLNHIINNNNNNKKEVEYQPLNKKNKTKKTISQKKIINFKKSNSLKGDLWSQIYQPETNITNSPSFTPIKSHYNKQKNKNNNENNTPNFNSKASSNTNINSLNNKNKLVKNFPQKKIFTNNNNNNIINNNYNNDEINTKRINKNKRESKNQKCNSRTGSKTPTARKNLTPTKIPGIWVESNNNKSYDKTYSIDKNENNKNINNNNITSTSYINNSSINISSGNSTELYWKRKEIEKEIKLEQIRTERLLKEEKELQDRPKINYNSKRIIDKKIKNLDVFDRLSDINQIKNHRQEIERMREQFKDTHTPCINDNSRKMKRTIDDLYKWKNVNERKKTESANNFNKMKNNNRFKINPLSEEILREKKSDYLTKKVEDRLLEQGKIQKYKNEIEREKYLQNMTKAKKYINNEYINVQSRYLESPHSPSNMKHNDKYYKSCDRIVKRGNKIYSKALSINNNNINNISGSFVFNEGNSFYNQNGINNFKNYNLSEKEILFNNNGNYLINGNINNYFINKRNVVTSNQNINTKNNINID